MLAAWRGRLWPDLALLPASVPHHTHAALLCGIRHSGVPLNGHGRLSCDRHGIWRGLALCRCLQTADEGSEEWMGRGWEDLCRTTWCLVLLWPVSVVNCTVVQLGRRNNALQWSLCSQKYSISWYISMCLLLLVYSSLFCAVCLSLSLARSLSLSLCAD